MYEKLFFLDSYSLPRRERRSIFSRVPIILLMFYPPKGDAKHIQWGSDCFYLCFIPRRKMRSISSRGPIDTSFYLSPEGRCIAYPAGVQLFLLMFYPPKGDTQYLTRGPIDTLSIYCHSERILTFQNIPLGEAFFKP